jgi:TRAP-type mannitol/chloroaromatic compound transport system permease small subunit
MPQAERPVDMCRSGEHAEARLRWWRKQMNPIDRIIQVIDRISLWSGKVISWLIIPMIGVLVWEVLIRYIDRPTLWAVDIATMTYGTHFFIAGAMTLYLGKHIRTDFFYGKWSPKTQAWVDVICYVFLFLPGMVMFAWLSWDFFAESWDLKEKLMTTWRPPAYFYKLVIPVSASLILLQGVSEILKSVKLILTGKDERKHAAPTEIT